MFSDLVTLTDCGLFCQEGDFYIDPWRPVKRALITHAHSDHARQGSDSYLTAASGERLLRSRLGAIASIQTVPYGETLQMKSVKVSLHPAGHILGSAQVRIEHKGEIWVVSGDYKIQSDSTCDAFEAIPCHTFLTESTFALPIYRWQDPAKLFSEVNLWWQKCKENGKTALLFGYSLGKCQRLLAGVDTSIGPIYTHGAVENLNQCYRQSGVALPATRWLGSLPKGTKFAGALVLAPPSASSTPWTRQLGATSTAFASGWMRIRGTRRRRAIDRGFVISDHVDWPGLNETIKETGANRIIATHGYSSELVRWLKQKGINAETMTTKFDDQLEEPQDNNPQDNSPQENNPPTHPEQRDESF